MDSLDSRRARMAIGRLVYGLGLMALGLEGLVWGDFVSGQPVGAHFPGRAALAYVAAGFLVLAGGAIEWRRTTAWGGAAIAAYYALVVIVVMNGPVLVGHFAEYGTYEDLAEQFGIAAGGLIVFATFASMNAARAARLVRAGQIVFGMCALVFGGAHFVYMNLTAPLVPKWLPPGQVFWGYATGVGFIAAGIALVTRVRARLAAILLTGMLASFAVLVHARILVGDPSSRFNWSESAVNLLLMGAAWVVADSLREAASS